jgi:hypothetical protein
MDTQYQYLDSLGNMFLNAARGQKQIEEFSKLMGFGLLNFQSWNEPANRFFGFDTLGKSTTEVMKFYRRILEEFQQSIKGFLSLMDLVPKRDYLELLQQYEDLKKRSRETGGIGLENILQEGLSLQSEGLRYFEELAKKQTKEFQNLMTSFTQILAETKKAPSPSAAAQEAETPKAAPPKRKAPSSSSRGASAGKEPKK